MHRLGLIVEGHGEVDAAPVLVRRVVATIAPEFHVEILKPFRMKRQKVVKPGELERVVEFMAGQVDALLVLLDADADCPAELGPSLLSRAQAVTSTPVAVVVAKREFEAWFVASLPSLRGHRTLAGDSSYEGAPEDLRDPKEWLAVRMTKGYSETLDQAAFAAKIEVSAARVAAPSFAKLVRDLARLLGLTPAASG